MSRLPTAGRIVPKKRVAPAIMTCAACGEARPKRAFLGPNPYNPRYKSYGDVCLACREVRARERDERLAAAEAEFERNFAVNFPGSDLEKYLAGRRAAGWQPAAERLAGYEAAT